MTEIRVDLDGATDEQLDDALLEIAERKEKRRKAKPDYQIADVFARHVLEVGIDHMGPHQQESFFKAAQELLNDGWVRLEDEEPEETITVKADAGHTSIWRSDEPVQKRFPDIDTINRMSEGVAMEKYGFPDPTLMEAPRFHLDSLDRRWNWNPKDQIWILDDSPKWPKPPSPNSVPDVDISAVDGILAWFQEDPKRFANRTDVCLALGYDSAETGAVMAYMVKQGILERRPLFGGVYALTEKGKK